MKERRSEKKKIIYFAVWLVCMAAAIYFCAQKSGFHADEYYSYYSTEKTKGLNLPESGWLQHDDYYNEFRVLKGEGFRYGLVKQIQSWDVHPPMYYWVLHTVCSLFPGTFSKWTGLGINLVFHGISLWLIMYLTQLLLEAMSRYGMKRKVYVVEDKVVTPIEGTDDNASGGVHFLQEIKEFLPAFVMAAWGLSPESISEVTFIRMYAMLTMLVFLTLIVHIRQMTRQQTEKLPVKEFVIPTAVLTYVGFMTHYYYVVFLFFIALFFWIWRIRELKRNRNNERTSSDHLSGIFGRVLSYPLTLIIPLILGYLTYPSCLGQIFRGQRGTQAAGSFADASNTFARIKYFGGVLNDQSFGGLLILWIVLVITLIIAAKVQKTDIAEMRCPECMMTIVTAVLYFLIISKTGLQFEDQSIRYLMPVCGISVMLILTYLTCLSEKLKMRISTGALAAAFIALDIVGLYNGKVQFLYKEDSAQILFAEENKNTPVIYLYDSAQKWCVWDSADELFEYPEVYFADRAQLEAAADSSESGSTDRAQQGLIIDKKITDASSLVVYVARCDDETMALRGIMKSSGLKDYEKQYSDTYCDVYLFK